MGGFMPLIEGFLAFALTMLALSTAVSALVGVWLRFFRWRAWGFRRSMETIYDHEIEPRGVFRFEGTAVFHKNLKVRRCGAVIAVVDRKIQLRG